MPAARETAARTALVTGGARGIGLAISQRFLRDGYRVAITDINPKAMAGLEPLLAAHPEHLMRLEVDVTDRAAVQGAVDRVVGRWGRLDVLVNNAGRNRMGNTYDTTEANWDWILDTNLKAVFFCSQAAAQQMRAQGGGAIVNISSTSASGMDGNPAYSASKAGVIGLTYTIARECGKDWIRVNAVAPGGTKSEWVLKSSTPARLEEQARKNPLPRMAETDDIAGCVAFLASEDARHITGQVISVSGGLWMP